MTVLASRVQVCLVRAVLPQPKPIKLLASLLLLLLLALQQVVACHATMQQRTLPQTAPAPASQPKGSFGSAKLQAQASDQSASEHVLGVE